jgi:hypothetical protein
MASDPQIQLGSGGPPGPESRSQIQFGSGGPGASDRPLWLLVVPVVLIFFLLGIWAVRSAASAAAAHAQLDQAKNTVAEMEKSGKERDKALADAAKDDQLLRSAGQATSTFAAAGPDATESGVALANPNQKAVRVILYGLVQPPEGQEYAVVARPKDGAPQIIGTMLPNDQGDAFVLARNVPDGTVAIDVMLHPTGDKALEKATPRVSARYPASAEERGVLQAKPAAQARKGARKK